MSRRGPSRQEQIDGAQERLRCVGLALAEARANGELTLVAELERTFDDVADWLHRLVPPPRTPPDRP